MQMPVDHPDSESRIHCPNIKGDYAFKNALFRYGDESSSPVLPVKDLRIEQGERIAVLGRNGAGKSTLLLALSGLLDSSEGDVALDHLSLSHIDPADVRRDIGLLTQNSRLFFGTLRDNIIMGAPNASDEEIQRVLSMVGADSFVRKMAQGLEHLVGKEGAVCPEGRSKPSYWRACWSAIPLSCCLMSRLRRWTKQPNVISFSSSPNGARGVP